MIRAVPFLVLFGCGGAGPGLGQTACEVISEQRACVCENEGGLMSTQTCLGYDWSACDCVTPTTCASFGRSRLVASGAFHTSLGDVSYAGGLVTASVQHAEGRADLENGCFVSVELTLLNQAGGCPLELVFEYGRLNRAIFKPDGKCPAFLADFEGTWAPAFHDFYDLKGSVYDGPRKAVADVTGAYCTPQSDLTMPNVEMVFHERINLQLGRSLTGSIRNLSARGWWKSFRSFASDAVCLPPS